MFPAAGLAARFATSEDPGRRPLALRDPALTAEALEAFTRDPEWECCRRAARDPRMPLARVRVLPADLDTAGHAAGNPALPVEDMHRLLDAAGVAAQRGGGRTGGGATRAGTACDGRRLTWSAPSS